MCMQVVLFLIGWVRLTEGSLAGRKEYRARRLVQRTPCGGGNLRGFENVVLQYPEYYDASLTTGLESCRERLLQICHNYICVLGGYVMLSVFWAALRRQCLGNEDGLFEVEYGNLGFKTSRFLKIKNSVLPPARLRSYL